MLKQGTAEQRQPLIEAKPLKCHVCHESFSHHGALTVHSRLKHPHEVFSRCGISTATLEQIHWLKENGTSEFEAADKEDEDAMDEVASECEEMPQGVESVEKRRGQPRRVRRTLKFKFRAVALLTRMMEELGAAADEEGAPPPMLKDAIAKTREAGMMEPDKNLYRWFKDRTEIARCYAIVRLRKQKTLGSGQHGALPVTEQAVKDLVLARRMKGLRVSRSMVKTWLMEKAAQLEPVAAAKIKFGKNYMANAYRRMGLVVRRISSSKAVKNDEAADFGRFFCRQLMHLRLHGFSSIFTDKSWCLPELKDSVFGFFPPEFVFAADEVPFNFAADGSTVSEQGQDAAVRTLRGTGKRFGTCVVICSAAGDLLKFVLIFKAGVKGLKKAEIERFKQFPNVVVVHSKSSYITEEIWRQTIINDVLFKHIQGKYGRDFYKRRYLFLSDNHSSHQTTGVLKECYNNCIYACFTPPNYTTHWSLIDDYVGTGVRQIVYEKAQEFECEYFESNADGDGGIGAPERRELVVKWWHESWAESQSEGKRQLRVNAAKCVGLWVTSEKPADTTYLPNPVRFQDTAFRFFGEILYDVDHADHAKEKSYHFAFPREEKEPVIEELQAEDEDGHSLEEPCVWQEDEIQADQSDEEEVDGAMEELEEHFPDILAQIRANREKQPAGNIVAQFQRLEDVDGRRRKKKN
ncbi:MAG: hypothetical protein ACAH17_01790 [Candidatus Paceibacterota bacterium]